MSEITSHAPGTFCWIELGTTDQQGAKAFYSSLFGWTPDDMPLGEDLYYTMLQRQGQEVAALYELMPQEKAQGRPPSWQCYVNVTSVDDTVAQVQALGGQVVAAPMDIFDAGRMAVVQDPTGAVFGLWQAGQTIGARRVDEPGTHCWTELATHDTGTAEAFYTRLFGWGKRQQDMGEMGTYTSFTTGDRSVAGMMQIGPAWGEQWSAIPSAWWPYVAVEDCDASAEKARTLGATIHVPPTDIPEVGRFAMVQDPQGAMFYLITLLPRA